MVRIDRRVMEVHTYMEQCFEVAERLNLQPNKRMYMSNPDVKITLSKRSSSSGRNTGGWLIKMNVGTDIADLQHCVMHEVAHSIAGCSHGHDEVFYAVLLKMAKGLGRDMARTFERESWYKPRGLRKAARSLRLESRYMPRKPRARSTGEAPNLAAEARNASWWGNVTPLPAGRAQRGS
jgi:hypothetical protein